MELSVNAILATIDDGLREAGARDYRAHAGLEPPVPRTEALAPLAEVTRPETIAFVRELSGSSRIDAVKRARLERLLALLLRLAGQRHLAPLTDAIDQRLRTKTVVAAGRTWTIRELLADAWTLGSSEARALAALERDAALRGEAGLFERRADQFAANASTLGLPSALAWAEAVFRRSYESSTNAAGAVLRESDDAARDLTSWALKQVDPSLKPRQARAPDFERALAAPWFFEVLRKEDLTHAVTRMHGELGFHPSAEGRLLVDTDVRPQRSLAALVPIEVPDQLRLVLTPAPGFEGWEAWLGAWGEGQFHAGIPRSLPFIDRVVGDGSLALAVRRLHESVLLDAAWLKRAVRSTSTQAREVARTFAWRQLMALRREAALVEVTREFLLRGPSAVVADGYAAALERATGVSPERARAFLDLDALSPLLPSLEAWALESHLWRVLRERYNEDWWRNPAAGRFLGGLAAGGATETAAQVATALGLERLDPVDAVRRRVPIMGA